MLCKSDEDTFYGKGWSTCPNMYQNNPCHSHWSILQKRVIDKERRPMIRHWHLWPNDRKGQSANLAVKLVLRVPVKMQFDVE